jgi:uncharacterized protein DUF1707
MGMEHDPNVPGREPDLRASNAERAQIIELLRRHHESGRLTAEELAEAPSASTRPRRSATSMPSWRTCPDCCRLWLPTPRRNGRPGRPGKPSAASSSPTW